MLLAQPMSGSLRLDVGKLINNGVLEWMDTLRPAQPLPTDAEVSQPLASDRASLVSLQPPAHYAADQSSIGDCEHDNTRHASTAAPAVEQTQSPNRLECVNRGSTWAHACSLGSVCVLALLHAAGGGAPL